MNYWMVSPEIRANALITFYQIGHEKQPFDGKFGPYVRDYYLLHYVIDGAGVFDCAGKQYKLTKGSLFLIKPNVVTTYTADPTNPYEYYWIGFNGPRCEELVKSMGFDDDIFVIQKDNMEEIINLFEKCYHPYSELTIKEYLKLYESMFNILYMFSNDGTYYTKKYNETNVVKNAVMFIEHNYMEKISVEDIANSIFLSRSQTYRLFMNNYGISPSQYLIDFRLNKADNLVLNTDCSIKEIAYQVGFSDYAYFVSCYKKKFLKTPIEKRICERQNSEDN